jgi:hypothetical protein
MITNLSQLHCRVLCLQRAVQLERRQYGPRMRFEGLRVELPVYYVQTCQLSSFKSSCNLTFCAPVHRLGEYIEILQLRDVSGHHRMV